MKLCNLFVILYREQQVEEDMKAIDQCPDFLSLEQHQLLSGKPSLKGLMERLHEMKHKSMLQVKKQLTAFASQQSSSELVCVLLRFHM